MEQDAVYFSAEISDPVEGLSLGQTIATFSMQHIATLLGVTSCARLATLLRGVVRCCDMLGVVGSKLENGQTFHATFMDVA